MNSENWADVYDEWYSMLDTTGAVDFIESRANGGPVLDVGTGTGRLAVPLAERGTAVLAVDRSPAMIAALQAKVSSADSELPLAIAHEDFSDFTSSERFSVVVFGFNSLCEAHTQGAQLEWLTKARKALRPDGYVVIDSWVPSHFPPSGAVEVAKFDENQVVLKVSFHDPGSQLLSSAYLELVPNKGRVFPMQSRYFYLSELDMMARVAGLQFVGRYSTWRGHRFVPGREWAISVYADAVGNIPKIAG
jgi:SAM-dependent methyltransferase